MDPLTAAISVASIGIQIFGASKSYAGAQEANQAQQQIVGLQQQENDQRRQQMELDASRKNMEVLRNSQKARAQALNNATNQGAQFGSGLQGGYGQISGATGRNLLGIAQDKQIGENIFNMDDQISQQRIVAYQGQSQEITGNAISGLGKDLASSVPLIGKLDQGLNFGSPSGGAGGMGAGFGGAGG